MAYRNDRVHRDGSHSYASPVSPTLEMLEPRLLLSASHLLPDFTEYETLSFQQQVIERSGETEHLFSSEDITRQSEVFFRPLFS